MSLWRLSDREQLGGQVFSVVDPSVHGHEPLQAGFVLHVGVVEARVEHDDGERQDVACVCSTQKATVSALRIVTETNEAP